jgi:twitching motility protein PilU
MLNTPHVAELVNRGDIAQLKEAFAQSSEAGMQSFDTALLELFKQGTIGMDEALANADSRTNLEASIHFG